MRNPLIRNVFHQYEHDENRLTHALVHALDADQELLRGFVEFSTGSEAPAGVALSLACQRQPGDSVEMTEDQAERLGIPDAWIYSEDRGWAIAVECKITASLAGNQINGHLAAALKRGFSKIQILVIGLEEHRPEALRDFPEALVKWKNWPSVFEFFSANVRITRVNEFVDYMRVLEAHLIPKIGQPLTKFVGIPFGPAHPFNVPEAKVVLRGLMRDLRSRLKIAKLPIQTAAKDKPLTGTWDVIRFQSSTPQGDFNRHPHLTVGIGNDDCSIQMTLPNKALPEYWRRLRHLKKEALASALVQVATNIARRHVERNIWEPQLMLDILQRHFYAQKYPITDGHLRFDLDNLAAGPRSEAGVKRVSSWLDAIHEVLIQGGRTGANLELALQARFTHSRVSLSRRAEFVQELARCAQGFEVFRQLLLGKQVVEQTLPEGKTRVRRRL